VGKEWARLCNVSELNDKPPMGRKAVAVDGTDLLVVRCSEDEVYVCQVAGTAYEFPLVDGTVETQLGGAWSISSPLDGSVYDLATGNVVFWCPTDTVARRVLNAKPKDPVPLRVYETRLVDSGDVFAKVRV